MKVYQRLFIKVCRFTAIDVLTQSNPEGDSYEYDPFMQ